MRVCLNCGQKGLAGTVTSELSPEKGEGGALRISGGRAFCGERTESTNAPHSRSL